MDTFRRKIAMVLICKTFEEVKMMRKNHTFSDRMFKLIQYQKKKKLNK